MSKSNRDILVENVHKLMKKKNTTQTELAKHLEMSQPNLSKALNPDGTQRFTLDQVCGIAEFFNVSIDSLIGHTGEQIDEISIPTLAKILSLWLESGAAKCTEITIEETIYTPHEEYDEQSGITIRRDADKSTRTVEYPAIYFPEYWQLTSPDDPNWNDLTWDGNDTGMRVINEFLRDLMSMLKPFMKCPRTEESLNAFHTLVGNSIDGIKTALPLLYYRTRP